MADDVLQEKLAPGLAVELRSPGRYFLATHAREQARLCERPVRDDCDTRVTRKRQDAFLRFALGDRVVELREFEILRLDQAFQLGIGTGMVVGDADVTNAPGGLPLL